MKPTPLGDRRSDRSRPRPTEAERAPRTSDPLHIIEVFADVTCPFTHVGLRRLSERRHELGRDDVTLWVRSWPLEIVNGAPLDAHFIAEEVDEMRRQVAPDAFAGFREPSFPSTSIPALALAAAAYEQSPITGERVSLALRDLLFEHGIDISDAGVLDDLARANEVPMDPADDQLVLADHEEGVARGVIGSPHFFTPTGDFFCPALDVHRDTDGRLRVSPDALGFERFLAACFA